VSALPLILLVYATQAVAGGLLLAAIDRGTARRFSERLSRALLLGPAALAVQMLLLDAAGVRFSLPAVLAPWWFAIAVMTAAAARRRGSRPPSGAAPGLQAPSAATVTRETGASGSSRLRLAVLGLAGVLALISFSQGLLLPVHTTDAMHNFAIVARVFETHGSLAPGALAELQFAGHTDYPPLVPLNEALLFLAAGDARALAIKPFFALAHLALLLLVAEACFRALPPRRAAALAAFAMLTPFFGMQATEGYADLRLAASTLLLALAGWQLQRAPSARRAVLFAACAASCALTKFEGLAIALAAAPLPLLLAARSARSARSAGSTGHGATWRAALTATALLLALSLAWPAHLATREAGGAPLAGAEWHDVSRAAERWPGAVRGLLALMVSPDGNGNPSWGLLWIVAGALGAWALLTVGRRRALAPWLALFAAHFALYATVLALSPSELDWHVNTAGPRLLLHLVPWALLAAIAAVALPAREVPG